MKIVPQNRTGLLPEHTAVALRDIKHVRMTSPVREALEAAGATVVDAGGEYTVTLGDRMPAGIVAVSIPDHTGPALRLEVEPEWPCEYAGDMWRQVEWTPCPECGAPLVWYEAGYVPGYRVCSRPPHHHSLVQ